MAKVSKVVTSDGIDKAYLKQIVDATTAGQPAYVGQVMGQPMLAHQPPLIEINPAVTNPADPTQVMCRSTQAAVDYLAANPETPAADAASAIHSNDASKYAILKGVVLPEAKRRGNQSGSGAPTKYPFASMGVGDTFFSGNSEHNKGDAVKALGSTISSQNKHYSTQVTENGVGKTKTVTRAIRDKQTHKAVIGADGKKVTETVDLPVLEYSRKFIIRPVHKGFKSGEWEAPEDGALVGRVK